ncbi:MAG: DUF3097 family protein [Actinomycetota bacterium]
MKSHEYGWDVLAPVAGPVAAPATVRPAVLGEVVEDATTGFTGEITEVTRDSVTLLGRGDRKRVFPLTPAGFLVDGEPVTLVRPVAASDAVGITRRTASGSIASTARRARVARAGRIFVEGKHDAELVEKVWGDDLRSEGVVVESLDGIDDLAAVVRSFAPSAGARLGVLVDHLVAGSKETRIVAGVQHPDVLILGHPYVDVWQAVKPATLGMAAWPVIPRGLDWKQGVCDALGVTDPQSMWRRILAAVTAYTDLEVPLLQAIEHLIDFVTSQP